MSVIIICRFHLTLHERNQSPNMISSLRLPLKSSFHDVAPRVHNSIVEEFGDSHMYPSTGTVTPVEEAENHQNTRRTTDGWIELCEFPWAAGEIGDTRTVGLVASGEHQLPSSSCYFYIKELCRIWNCRSLTNSSFDTMKLMITIYPGELRSALVCNAVGLGSAVNHYLRQEANNYIPILFHRSTSLSLLRVGHL